VRHTDDNGVWPEKHRGNEDSLSIQDDGRNYHGTSQSPSRQGIFNTVKAYDLQIGAESIFKGHQVGHLDTDIKNRVKCHTPMSENIRSFDWQQTALGPIESWPETLVFLVNLILAAQHPILLMLGPELVQVYNDAFAPILTNRHPTALGQPGRQLWQDVWPGVGEQLEAVINAGQSFRTGTGASTDSAQRKAARGLFRLQLQSSVQCRRHRRRHSGPLSGCDS
jgi:hypothetical protein